MQFSLSLTSVVSAILILIVGLFDVPGIGRGSPLDCTREKNKKTENPYMV